MLEPFFCMFLIIFVVILIQKNNLCCEVQLSNGAQLKVPGYLGGISIFVCFMVALYPLGFLLQLFLDKWCRGRVWSWFMSGLSQCSFFYLEVSSIWFINVERQQHLNQDPSLLIQNLLIMEKVSWIGEHVYQVQVFIWVCCVQCNVHAHAWNMCSMLYF